MGNSWWSDKTVLITGAAGFVGSNMCRILKSRGAYVVANIRDESKPIEELRKYADAVVPGDVNNSPFVLETLTRFGPTGVDIVFHLAAQTIVQRASESPSTTFANNIGGTLSIIEACHHIHSNGGKDFALVIASTDKVYGNAPIPYKEDTPLIGRHPYDASKVCCDVMAQCYSEFLPIGITRCGNIYGPGDPNLSRIVPGTIVSVLDGKVPVIRSDGTPKRDYLYVDDCIEGYLSVAEAVYDGPDKYSGFAFNLSYGEPISVKDFFQKILVACGKPDIEPKVLGEAKNEIHDQWLDSSLARKVLGWEPKVDLDEGLKRTVAWMKGQIK